MSCERCGIVRDVEKRKGRCSACYQWWRLQDPEYRLQHNAKCRARRLAKYEQYSKAQRKYGRKRKGILNPSGEQKVGPCENTGCDYFGPLHCDHWHHGPLEGQFRGWLCGGCNKSLGLLKDNAMRILKLHTYLTGGR